MSTGKSGITRRDFLGRAVAIVGGVSVGLVGLHTETAAAAVIDAAPRTAPVSLQGGASITAAMSERMLTLDPGNHYSISSTTVHRHIYDPLVDVTGDSQFVPALAESWEVVDDLTWRFTLRQGVTFHDGTPFDADSVVYSISRVATNSKLIKNSVFSDIASVEPEGPYSVIVRSHNPFGALLGHLTMLGMLPASAAANEDAFFESPVGTGPFSFAGWTRGESIDLTANPNYWNSGIPKVQSARFRFIPEVSTRAAGLRAGEIDVIDRIPADMVSTLQGDTGVQVLSRPAIETQQWVFQLANPPVDNLMVRKAISLGIDRETIINEFQLGYAQTATCPTPPGLIGFTDLGAKPYDVDAAKAMLAQSGVSNPTIDFVLMKGIYPKQLEIAEAVQAMLGEIGITVNVRELEVAAAREVRTAGNYHLFYSGWAHMPHDPDWYYGQWFTAKGAAGLSRFNNPAVEQLVIEARSTDNAVRQAKYEELQRIIWDDESTIWPYYSTAVYGTTTRVTGFEARPDYYVLLNEANVS
ncbi:MAG: ABC transporter substrate-binding protein [Chloroflexota bacterium]